MSRKSQLSAEDRQWCIDHFHEFTHREMADRFGVSIETVRNMLHKAGCRRTKEETHRFRASALQDGALPRHVRTAETDTTADFEALACWP